MQTNRNPLSFKLETDDYSVNSGAVIGEGTFAVVLRGRYNGKTVAIKRSKFSADDSSSFGSLQNDIDILEEITRYYRTTDKNAAQYFIQFYGWNKIKGYSNGGRFELIIEYANAGTLDDLLRKRASEFNWTIGYRLLHDMAKGVNALHNLNIVHRDIKEDNILLQRDANGILHGKLSDFGFAKKIDDRVEMVGSILYLAPEILSRIKTKPHSKKSDVYSMGITLFQMAVVPVTGNDMCASIDGCDDGDEQFYQHIVVEGKRDVIPANTPDKIKKITMWCWQQEADNRPTTDEIIQELKMDVDTISTELANLQLR